MIRYIDASDVPEAPKGYSLTGEFRVPQPEEFFVPYADDGRVRADTVGKGYPFRHVAGGARHILVIKEEPLVTFNNPEPTVSIDLKKLNRDYNTPLVLTLEQATRLLRELDAVIL